MFNYCIAISFVLNLQDLRTEACHRDIGRWTIRYEPSMCTRSPEGQLYLGLHQKQCGQQVEGGDSPLLLCSGETSLRVLCPALGILAQDRHVPAGAGPEEGHKNDPRAGTPPLCKKDRESWGCWAWRRLHEDLVSTFHYLNRAYRKDRETFYQVLQWQDKEQKC